MKKIILIILIFNALLSCNSKKSEKKNERRAANNVQIDSASLTKDNALFLDKSTSSFAILSGKEDTGYDYQIVEVNYKVVYIRLQGLEHYIAKQVTTTNTCTGCEDQKRNIKIYISPCKSPENIVATIDKDCDEIQLNVDTYTTIAYGCCGAESEYEIFDYQNSSIIQTEGKIVYGDIPNSTIKFYIGFKTEGDANCLGFLTYSYGSDDKYIVKVRLKKNEADLFTQFSPDIEIKSSSKKDNVRDGGYIQDYQLWSLNFLKHKSEINNLTIRLTFDKGETLATTEIPIVNGVPFGKNEREQTAYIDD